MKPSRSIRRLLNPHVLLVLLPLIAFQAYENPAKWRVIADANNLDDVRTLTPGTRLTLPPTI